MKLAEWARAKLRRILSDPSAGVVVVLLQALERQGLVVRSAQAPVGRALPTELTARGRRQLGVASAAVRRVEQDMLANLDAGEQDQMRRLLTACIASLTEPPAPAT